ncbi:C-type lectin domain family 4 member K-like [Alosa sapidissima]|uniref:C-type lectin domain family 4 member K-like n=1 Tax=Alosa sapidissima TaxID=34773 RepID=UPI001C08DECD|nr:C-type lectin domain family 4 member K-like [Alosa sapidissima]
MHFLVTLSLCHRSYRIAAVCFGVLCVLQAALNVSLRLLLMFSDHNKLDTHDFQAEYSTVSTEKDVLQTSQPLLWKKHTELKQECNKLQRKLYNLEKFLQQGWSYFNSSIYFISSERKSWSSSRKDCRERSADLVIINSREEQEYLKRFGVDMWMGLTDADSEGL